ncbi:RNA 2',3'-cyclic phosphodiesterase [Methylobacterium dankookense]|uniref:RNA 2',3'-cyclic phosphodiesterase n=1 Tax=Methylobacterium dankookense TaxID=560405 RepID=A0A564G362_9HYPH|nr:RNA 2',3'-cyclic phosphodiesterase [Methylobacterium dankookense]GJD56941.1 RNA 2',3'-cyclic phosphodiesterase [Methylobacterium dankookense]VUF14552.1 RNA 2',3'-cyclic phosphodiesterase [Methylobacterium dankookense]
MPRLFTGLPVPPEIGARLARFRGGLPGARWVEESDYHVTLRFLGDIDADVAEDVLEALSSMRPRPPITVTLDGLGAFGGDRPRALFASVAQEPELMDLQVEQERLVRRAGVPPETRRFTPHVTLARLRREASPEGVAMYVAQSGLFEPLRFEARAVTVFSARESTGGGPYVAEAELPFA